MKPQLTIQIYLEDSAPQLSETIEALLGQSFKNFELQLLDASRERLVENIYHHYRQQDERLLYVSLGRSQDNGWGIFRGMDLARGDYLLFVSPGDLCMPWFLENCVQLLDHSPEVVACYSRALWVNEHGGVAHYDGSLPSLMDPNPGQRYRSLKHLQTTRRWLFGGVLRTYTLSVILQTLALHSDTELLRELVMRGQIYQVPQLLYYRRMEMNPVTVAPQNAPAFKMLWAPKPTLAAG